MGALSYRQRRSQVEHYFDRTAAATWARLTSTDPVGRIRQTVRAGRDSMRSTLLDWLPEDLHGRRLLDAGCGTGALACEAARRGAAVVAVDLSPTLVALAAERYAAEAATGEAEPGRTAPGRTAPGRTAPGRVDFQVGDMADLDLGVFDHVVAMDSLIHYAPEDGLAVLERLAASTRHSLLFTFAPRTPLLGAMHALGQCFPRGQRSPAIEPISPRRLWRRLELSPALDGWQRGRSERISRGFYISQACELVPL
jgi:magnesium-protoporphyrin O-methyltransferase